MVEHVDDERLDDGVEVREVDDPAKGRVDRTFDLDLEDVRVAVEPAALVPRQNVRQQVRALERVPARDLHRFSFRIFWISASAIAMSSSRAFEG